MIVLVLAVVGCGGSSGTDGGDDADTGADVADETGDAVDAPVDYRRSVHRCADDAGVDADAGERCAVVDPAMLGSCGVALGFVFDGIRCREVEGCAGDVASGSAFEDELSCVWACAEEGWCAVGPADPRESPVCPGTFCHAIEVCIRAGSPEGYTRVTELATIRPCRPEEYWSCWASDVGCVIGVDWSRWSSEQHREVCAISLLSEVQSARCGIYM